MKILDIGKKEEAAGLACEKIVTTRTALIALRNAGTLELCNVYCFPITQVDGGGEIHLRPLDVDVLPSNVHWEHPTLTNGTAWPAYYDIDANELQMLHDPVLNNTVFEEADIAAFPWGVTTVTHNHVENARLNYTAGTFTDNNLRAGAVVNMNGGSNIARNYFGENAIVTIDSGDFRENRVENGAIVSSSTTGDVDSNTFANNSNTIVTGTGNLDDSSIHSNANLTINGGTVTNSDFANLSNTTINGGTFNENTVGQDADVTINSGSNYENIFGRSTVYNQVGTGYIRYSQIEGTTTWTNGDTNVSNVQSNVSTINTTGSAGTISNSNFSRLIGGNMQNVASLTITDSSLSDYSQVSINGAARFYFYRSSGASGARLLASAGVRSDLSYCNIDSYGYVQVTAGDLRCTGANVSAYAYIQHTSTGANLVIRTTVDSQSYLRFRNTATGNRVYYSNASGGGRIDVYGTTSGSYVYYSSAEGYGRLSLNNTVGARMYYCSSDANGYILSQGNTAVHYMYYCHADSNAQVSALDNTGGVRMYSIHADSQSIARLRNSTGTGRIYYSSFHAYYYAYITLTGALVRSGLHGYGRRTYTITDPPNGTFTQNF